METLVSAKSNLRAWQEKIVVLWLFSQFAFLISLGNVGTLPLSIPFVLSAVYIEVSVSGILMKQIELDKRNIIYFGVMLGIFGLAFIFSAYDNSLTSMALYVYYFALPVLLDRRGFAHVKLEQIADIFILVSVVCAAYGIYQFAAYNVFSWLPFKELVPEELWTEGYNTISQSHQMIGGHRIYRAHSIYDEPSTLSRMCSIGLTFLLLRRKKYKPLKFIIYAGVQAAAMALTLAGAGIVFLAVGLVIAFITADTQDKLWMLSIGACLLIAVTPFLQTDLVQAYLSRLTELDAGAENTSGYYRFRLPFMIGLDKLKEGPFGYGFGNDDIALSLYGGLESGIPNGFGKMFVDVGVFGFIGLMAQFWFLDPYQAREKKPADARRVQIVLFALAALSCYMSSFLSPTAWCYIVLLRGLTMADEQPDERHPEVHCEEDAAVEDDETIIEVK